jgi:acyl carrier protein
MSPTPRARIESFLAQTLLLDDTVRLAPDTDLFREGLIDSFGYVQLVAFLEQEFGIKIGEDELMTDALSTVPNMERLVLDKLAARRRAA